MHPVHVNVAAFVVAVIIKQAIGGFWFSPIAFGPAWMRFTGGDETTMRAGMAKALTLDVIGGVIMAFILLHAVVYAGATTAGQGAGVGIANWIGFVAVGTLPMVSFEKRPARLWMIYNAYFLIALIIMGAIFAAWR